MSSIIYSDRSIYSSGLTFDDLQTTHTNATIDDEWHLVEDEATINMQKKCNNWLKSKIGKKIYFVLREGSTACIIKENRLSATDDPKTKRIKLIEKNIVLVVRLGNYIEGSKIFIDFPNDAMKYHEISKYPCRCNDQYGHPIEEGWNRIYMGIGLAASVGSFYIPKLLIFNC
jgi:hypothetical protein